MTYYKLFLNHTLLKTNNFNLIMDDDVNVGSPVISKSLSYHLCNLKAKIDDCQSEWDNIKKCVNPYEYVHTVVPKYKFSISTYKPLSRSFFKLIEMYNTFNLSEFFLNKNIQSFHLAEGPGGFIEALTYQSQIHDKYME